MNLTSTSILVFMLSIVMPVHAAFKCVDEKGVTHYGDTMPPQCAKKEITEISKTGSIIRKYEPPLTPEQQKLREEERIKQAEIQRLVDAQRQKDLALLSTYGSEREFDRSRDRDLLQLDGRINTLKQRIGEIDTQVVKLQAEMEFYESDANKSGKAAKGEGTSSKTPAKSAEVPPRLTQALARAKSDRVGLDEEISRVEQDKLAVAARYDANKARWKKMKSGMQPGTLGDISNKPSLPVAPTAATTEAAVDKRPAAPR